MAWIESHQELGRHPKTRKLARVLGTSIPAVIGHLHFFWWWALDFAQDGDLARFEAEEIADAALWEGEASEFYHALVTAGFVEELDGGRSIHDWDDYAGKLIDKRKANAERMRQARATDNEKRATHVQRTLHARAGATVPYPTVPNPTTPGERGDTPSPSSRSRTGVAEKGRSTIYTPESEPVQLAAYLRDRILAHKPDARDALAVRDEKRLQNWARVCDLMLRADGRQPERVRKVIDFATSDPFWRGNILSPGSLRQKFDQLELRMTQPVPLRTISGNGHRVLPPEPEPYLRTAADYPITTTISPIDG